MVGDGSGCEMWLRAERVRVVVGNHLDRKLLQRMQALAWVSGCVSYRLGRFSYLLRATSLLPPKRRYHQDCNSLSKKIH